MKNFALDVRILKATGGCNMQSNKDSSNSAGKFLMFKNVEFEC